MKEYQFAYGHGSVTVPLDEGSVLAVLHGNDAPAMQDIRAGLLESLAHPIGSKPLCEEIPAGASGPCGSASGRVPAYRVPCCV